MSECRIRAGLIGLCVGNSIGVPIDGESRENLRIRPVTDMMGYGRYFQPPGTWSDDSSLALCTAASVSRGLDLEDMADCFCEFYYNGYWTPGRVVFKLCQKTRRAIRRLRSGCCPTDAGRIDDEVNCNGSLKRVLPLAHLLKNLADDDRLPIVHDMSSLTHAQPVSQVACGIYIEMAVRLLKGAPPNESYLSMRDAVRHYYSRTRYHSVLAKFERILITDILTLPEWEIVSGCYVVHTLEAGLWCLLNYDSYVETVLAAVNLGDDTDTTAAVAGGLAGIWYGEESVPEGWIDALARKEDILDLCYGIEAHATV